jgi:hypothetical protein
MEMIYLGITIDKTLLYKSHISKTAMKGDKIITQLSRLMPNIGGPKSSRRKLLVFVVHSILLYGPPTWTQVVKLSPRNTKALNQTHR